jgi:glycosyltransferase 2 family protein
VTNQELARHAAATAAEEGQSHATVRSPTTALRLVVALAGVAVAYAFLLGSGGDTSTFATRFGRTLARPPRWLVNPAVASLQLVTFAAPVAGILALLVTRRFARLISVLVSGIVAAAALVGVAAAIGTDVLHLGPPGPGAYGPGAAFPTTAGLAVLGAIMMVDASWWASRLRRVAVVVMICAIGARLGSALADPPTIVMALAVAAAAAALTHLMLGIPNHRPTERGVATVLRRYGFHVGPVTMAGTVDFRGVSTFLTCTEGGQQLCVKVVSRESWAARLPLRTYRSIRYRELGDDRPFASVRRRVEHEALCALTAHSNGVPTPRLALLTSYPNDAMVMAFEITRLRTITELESHERTHDLLTNVWKTIATLRASHIVHRHLDADHLMFDDKCVVVVRDFSTAELGASERAMGSDVAEVLAITAARLGTGTAVATAIEVIGPAAVASASPRLQLLALTRSTRAAVKEADCLDAVRDEVHRATGVSAPPDENLERLRPRTVLTVAMAALALWAIVPEVVGAGNIWAQVRSANWGWAAATLGLSAVTYLAAAVALDGSVAESLPLGPNIGVQFATSFASIAAPGGGLALTGRFLQRRGIDPARAVAAVGVDTVAGAIVHAGLIGVFAAWAGTSGLESFRLPALDVIVGVCIGAAAIGMLIVAVPRARALLAAHLVPPIRRAATGIVDTARQPSNLAELFGGSTVITIGNILALEASIAAFGVGPPFTSVALVYLLGAVVFSVAPTPGGIGAVEATLTAGLASAGMSSSSALGAVLLFRIATFWLPLLPGWLAFSSLQRSGDL